MRYLIFSFILLYTSISLAQTYEIGPMLGATNYIGDVGDTQYIAPKTLGAGGIFKWNRSNRHSFRFSLFHSKIKANDADAKETRRKLRGYSFKNKITEASLGIEYTFWEWDLHNLEAQWTPYIYTGLTGVFTQDMFIDRRNKIIPEDNKFTSAIPMVLGVKGTLSTKWILAFEIGARYTFTDNLDGSNPEEIDAEDVYPSFGSANSNDWYVFTGITLTYSFGRKPCYCKF
jgi:hypothetical protein